MTQLDEKKRVQYYGNVLSDLQAGAMTWRTFKRGPMILGATKMTMLFTLHHLRCQTTHRLVIQYPPASEVDVSSATSKSEPTELSLFFTNILMDLGVNVGTFNRLLTVYMRRHHVSVTPSNRTYMRGNLKKEFQGKRLSWASFNRGIDFLTIPRYDVQIDLEFKNKRNHSKKLHETTVVLNDLSDMMSDMDESDFLTPGEEPPF